MYVSSFTKGDIMVKNKETGSLIVISGPSGAGKGTVCKELINDSNIRISVSMTTREPRDGEINGKDYYFVSKEEFLDNIDKGNLLEYATVHGSNYYGTPKNKVLTLLNDGFDVILEIDIQGALKIKESINDAIYIFIMPPSMRELKNRLVKRKTETKEQLVERFKNAYKEINEISKYNYVVINDEVEKCANKIRSIINAEKCRVDRIIDFDLNSEEELIHELLIQ